MKMSLHAHMYTNSLISDDWDSRDSILYEKKLDFRKTFFHHQYKGNGCNLLSLVKRRTCRSQGRGDGAGRVIGKGKLRSDRGVRGGEYRIKE